MQADAIVVQILADLYFQPAMNDDKHNTVIVYELINFPKVKPLFSVVYTSSL